MERHKEIINKITKEITSEALIWYWIKDLDFVFSDISDKASNILWNINWNKCIWRSDYEISVASGMEMTEEQFIAVCRRSDTITFENKDKVITFIEFIDDTKWGKHLWKTYKWISESKFYYWVVLFLDEIYWSYEKALEWFEMEKEKINVIKINDLLYKYE